MSGNTPFAAVDSDVSPALLPLASQQAVAVSTTVSTPTIDRGTSFPASPSDKAEYCYVADATNGIVWRFKYNAGSASANKWECIGGPPLVATVTARETTTSATYAALATPGPSILLPLAGDYDVVISFEGFSSTVGGTLFMSYDIGGTGAVDGDAIHLENPNDFEDGIRLQRKTGLSAVTLTTKYRTTVGTTGNFGTRYLSVRPVRVSG